MTSSFKILPKYIMLSELMRTRVCLSRIEQQTDVCRTELELSREDTASRREQRKIEEEDARLEYCKQVFSKLKKNFINFVF